MYAHRGGYMIKSTPDFLKGFRTEITQRYNSHANVTKDKLMERVPQSSNFSSNVCAFFWVPWEGGRRNL